MALWCGFSCLCSVGGLLIRRLPVVIGAAHFLDHILWEKSKSLALTLGFLSLQSDRTMVTCLSQTNNIPQDNIMC